MEQLPIVSILTAFIVIASFLFDSWGENLLKRNNKTNHGSKTTKTQQHV